MTLPSETFSCFLQKILFNTRKILREVKGLDAPGATETMVVTDKGYRS